MAWPRLLSQQAGTALAALWLVLVALVFVAGAWRLTTARAGWITAGFLLACMAVWATTVPFVSTLLAARRQRPPLPAPAPPGLTVDVFVPTLDEDVELLRRTLRRANGLAYPHTTWVLDDGNRAEVRALAGQLGCHYLARGERAGAKAGNLNAGLAASDGEFVLVLDADALAHPATLERLLGHFRDPRVALVQAPQLFYNVDALDTDFDARRRTLWSHGVLFQMVVQRGNAAAGATLCVGSGFVLRRSAILAVGGIPTDGVSEDVPTSFELHRAGWETRFHDEALVYHLAADGLAEFWSQHRRWTRGSLGIARRLLRRRGLRAPQLTVYAKFLVGHFADLLWYPIRLLPAVAALGPLPFDPLLLGGSRLGVALGLSACALSYLVPPLLSDFAVRPLLGRAFSLLRAGPVAAALLPAREPLRSRATPKRGGSRAPWAVYALPMLATLLGGGGSLASAWRVAHAAGAGELLAHLVVGLFCLELFVTGCLALWLCRGRHVAEAVETVPVLMQAAFSSSPERDLVVVRLGRDAAFAVGPAGMPPAHGRLRLSLPSGEIALDAALEPAPDRLEPRPAAGQACYRLAFTADAATADRVTDAVDAIELPRLFASLRDAACPPPPGAPVAAGLIPLYRVRPAFPRIRV